MQLEPPCIMHISLCEFSSKYRRPQLQRKHNAPKQWPMLYARVCATYSIYAPQSAKLRAMLVGKHYVCGVVYVYMLEHRVSCHNLCVLSRENAPNWKATEWLYSIVVSGFMCELQHWLAVSHSLHIRATHVHVCGMRY